MTRPIRKARTLEVFTVECHACVRQIEVPVKAARQFSRCPSCDAVLTIQWRDTPGCSSTVEVGA